jgi:hypothetical protein
MNCNGPDCYYRVTRLTNLPVLKWHRLDEMPIIDPRDNSVEAAMARQALRGTETVQEDILVSDIWRAFNAAVDLLRQHMDTAQLPQLVRDVYFGKERG